MKQHQKELLTAIISREVRFDCSLKAFTSFAVGGPAAALVTVEKEEELQLLLRFIEREKIDWRIIGRGTNIVVRDVGYQGIIIILGDGFKELLVDTVGEKDNIVWAGAACSLRQLSSFCVSAGFSGLEFSAGIPGTVGGAIIMNAGAWGGEMAGVVHSVKIVTSSEECVVSSTDLDFAYRSWPGFSKFNGKGVITGAKLQLESADPVTIKERCDKLLQMRKKAQPITLPNAGSFFKNPTGDSAGRLIDLCGLKGTTVGGAMVSEQHGNFLVNKKSATANDIFELMQVVQDVVRKRYGITLEPEVHFI